MLLLSWSWHQPLIGASSLEASKACWAGDAEAGAGRGGPGEAASGGVARGWKKHSCQVSFSCLAALYPFLQRLAALGASTVGELRQISLPKLQSGLGAKTGQQLFNMARGRDERKVQVEHVRKTVSAEVNYGIRFASWSEAETFLGQLAGEVADRLQKVG